MSPCPSLLVGVLLLGGPATAPADRKKPADGVYAVQRDGAAEKDVLPLREGEVLVVDRHPYRKADDKEPPRYLVVRSTPDVSLDLAAEPKADREGKEVVRILLKLKPPAAKALERLTGDRQVHQVAIVLGGEVVTVHKVRAVIRGGEVQITSCTPGAAGYLLGRLKDHFRGR